MVQGSRSLVTFVLRNGGGDRTRTCIAFRPGELTHTHAYGDGCDAGLTVRGRLGDGERVPLRGSNPKASLNSR